MPPFLPVSYLFFKPNFRQIEFTVALTAGTTLDRMNLHGGDAVDVGASGTSLIGSVGRVILVVGALAASILSINALVNR